MSSPTTTRPVDPPLTVHIATKTSTREPFIHSSKLPLWFHSTSAHPHLTLLAPLSHSNLTPLPHITPTPHTPAPLTHITLTSYPHLTLLVPLPHITLTPHPHLALPPIPSHHLHPTPSSHALPHITLTPHFTPHFKSRCLVIVDGTEVAVIPCTNIWSVCRKK